MSEAKSEDNTVIVIGRQFGSGGRKLGHILAERLGLRYYDKELMVEASVELGFSKDIFANADERRPSAFKSMLQAAYGLTTTSYSSPMSWEAIYRAQSEVIRKLAQRSGCVIVGRTADYVLRDNPRLISIFLHAEPESRARAIIARGDARSMDEAIDMAHAADRRRESYYNYFTGRRWGYCDNYHLSLDTSHLSAEQGADVVEAYVRSRLNSLRHATNEKTTINKDRQINLI